MKYMDVPQLNQLSRLLSYESSECNVHTRIECYTMKPVNKDKRLWKALEKEYVEDQMEVNQALFGKDTTMNPPPSNHEKERRSRSVDSSANPTITRRSLSFNSYPTNHNNNNSSVGNSPLDPSHLRHQFSPTDDEDDRDVSSPVFRLPGQLDKSERKTLFVLKSTLNAAFPHHDFAVLRADQFSREKSATAVLGSLSNTFRSVGATSPSSENGGGGRGGLGSGRGNNSGGNAGPGGRGGLIAAGGALSATTYSAYPSEGSMFRSGSLPTKSEGIDVLRELERKQRGVNGDYDPDMVAATHPVLFGILDDAIGLKRDGLEVYVWTPSDLEIDPHFHGGGSSNGESDDDDSEESSTEEEEEDSESAGIFAEEAETESEEEGVFYPGSVSIRKAATSYYGRFSGIHQTGSFPTSREVEKLRSGSYGTRRFGQTQSVSPTRGHRLRVNKGSLLWSNHWFFVNRKQKRVLFISIWAKSRGHGFSPSSSTSLNRTGGLKHGLADRNPRGVGHGHAGAGETPFRGSGGGGERFVGWQGAHGAGARAFAARAGSSLF